MAHTKAGGTTKNSRDSAGRRLGVKATDGQFILAGSIIYRQRGTKIFPSNNFVILIYFSFKQQFYSWCPIF